MSISYFRQRNKPSFDRLVDEEAYTARETLLGQLLVMALILLGILLSSA